LFYLSQGLDTSPEKKDFDKSHSSYFESAPHTKLASSIRDDLEQVASVGWQPTFLKIVGDVSGFGVRNPYVEPLVQVKCLEWVMETGGQGDLFLRNKFKPVMEQIQAIDLVDVDWIAATNGVESSTDVPGYRAAAEDARRILQEVQGSVSLWENTAGEEAEEMSRLLTPQVAGMAPVGWLIRDSEGTWSVLGMSADLPKQTLYCLIADSAAGDQALVEPREIGVHADGQFQATDGAPLQAGRLVYAMPSATETETAEANR
jgi:hypothetical protein